MPSAPQSRGLGTSEPVTRRLLGVRLPNVIPDFARSTELGQGERVSQGKLPRGLTAVDEGCLAVSAGAELRAQALALEVAPDPATLPGDFCNDSPARHRLPLAACTSWETLCFSLITQQGAWC